MTLQGRRRPDTFAGELPDDIQRGDYWRILNADGSPRRTEHAGKLTADDWMVVAPMPGGGFGIGALAYHTVREHEDGTISVRPNDGSSNSILMRGPKGEQYHGYIERGVWT